MDVKAIPIKQHGKTMYAAVFSAKELVDLTKVDVWHPKNPQGYQREVSVQRARKFSNYITMDISPPAILANIRDIDESKLVYENGILHIDDGVTLWLVDGQHRVAGLKELLDSSGEKYEHIELPVIIMVGHSVYQEAKQFVMVNTSQKKVRTDLGERFLQKAIKEEGLDTLIKNGIKNIEWIPTSLDVIDIMNNDPNGIWHNLIRLPNEPKSLTIVSQKAFSDSLKSLLKEDGKYFKCDASYITPILTKYWEAIKEICPDVFANPRGFVMLKTTGVVVLHSILPRLLTILRNDSPEKDDFVKILRNIESITDYSKWKSPDGEYSRMTGMKGFLLIKMDLLDELNDKVGLGV